MSSSPAKALLTVLLTGCNDEGMANRPYYPGVNCILTDDTVADSVRRMDQDGDGRLTYADVRPGQTVVVLGVTGKAAESQNDVGGGRYLPFVDWNAYTLRTSTDGRDLVYLHGEMACLPTAHISVGITSPIAGKSESSLVDLEFSVAEEGLSTLDGVEAEGNVILESSGGVLSGFLLDGSATGALFQASPGGSPVMEANGQVVDVRAFAFRELDVAHGQ
jgi:hypothetical protein